MGKRTRGAVDFEDEVEAPVEKGKEPTLRLLAATIRVVGDAGDAEALRDSVLGSVCPAGDADAAASLGVACCVEDAGDGTLAAYAVIRAPRGLTPHEADAMLRFEGVSGAPRCEASEAVAFVMREGRWAGRPCLAAPAAAGLMASAVSRHGGRRGRRRRESVVAVSVETTGVDWDECEIVRVSMYGDGGDVSYDRTFGVSNPDAWSEDARRVSGITPESVEGLPTFREAMADPADDLRSRFESIGVLVGHNLHRFLMPFLARGGVDMARMRYGDTYVCYLGFVHGMKWHGARASLQAAAKAFGIAMPQRFSTPDKATVTYEVWLGLVARGAARVDTLDDVRERFRRSRKRRG